MTVIYNPNNLPPENLTLIYGYVAYKCPESGEVTGVLIDDLGFEIGSHTSSNEQWLIIDLGMEDDESNSRHEIFRKRYPEGYRTEFIPFYQVSTHKGLQDALKQRDYKRIMSSAEQN